MTKYKEGDPTSQMVGRMAVCHHGLIGVIDEVQLTPGGILCKGRNVLTGESWQSVRPNLLDDEVDRKLRKALMWFRDQEND